MAAIGVVLIASGCQNYHSRHEGVTEHAGNHLATNETLMADDYWKSNAYNTDIQHDGKRTADAVNKYKNSLSGEGSVELAETSEGSTN